MSKANRGEIWQADLGLAAKVRPVLIVSVPYGDADYALVSVVPHTTSPRGSQFEVSLRCPPLREGAFNIQGLLGIPNAKLLRKLGELTAEQLEAGERALKKWLDLRHDYLSPEIAPIPRTESTPRDIVDGMRLFFQILHQKVSFSISGDIGANHQRLREEFGEFIKVARLHRERPHIQLQDAAFDVDLPHLEDQLDEFMQRHGLFQSSSDTDDVE